MIRRVLGFSSRAMYPRPQIQRAARQATTTLSTVTYDFETDPVAEGYAHGIARPGQNVTGVFFDLPGFADKWFELLRECLPQLAQVALILDPGSGRVQVASMTKVAARLGISITLFSEFARNGGLLSYEGKSTMCQKPKLRLALLVWP